MFRGIVDNVLSGMKAGFKAILNLEHPFARRKMDTQKGSSKLSATLLALILGASVFMAGQVWAAKYVTDPSTGKVVTAPQYGGTLTQAVKFNLEPGDTWFSFRALGMTWPCPEKRDNELRVAIEFIKELTFGLLRSFP